MRVADPESSETWVSELFADITPRILSPVAGERRSFAQPDDEDPVARFTEVTRFEMLLRSALEATRIEVPREPLILVLGAGDGTNAVAPCLRVFRGARIAAADRTDVWLPRLRRRLIESGAADRVVWLEMEPESQAAPAERFDLVVGVQVLHRLLDPDLALENAHRVLKPGGHAIFMEPFDGYGLMRLAFERIARDAELRGDPLSPEVFAALSGMAKNIAARIEPDRNRPGFADMDEKWLFSRESLTAGARQIGFSEAQFLSHHDHPTLYRDFAALMLRRLLGPGAQLPDWGWAVFDDLDRTIPAAAKRLLMLEGTLVFSKPFASGTRAANDHRPPPGEADSLGAGGREVRGGWLAGVQNRWAAIRGARRRKERR